MPPGLVTRSRKHGRRLARLRAPFPRPRPPCERPARPPVRPASPPPRRPAASASIIVYTNAGPDPDRPVTASSCDSGTSNAAPDCRQQFADQFRVLLASRGLQGCRHSPPGRSGTACWASRGQFADPRQARPRSARSSRRPRSTRRAPSAESTSRISASTLAHLLRLDGQPDHIGRRRRPADSRRQLAHRALRARTPRGPPRSDHSPRTGRAVTSFGVDKPARQRRRHPPRADKTNRIR